MWAGDTPFDNPLTFLNGDMELSVVGCPPLTGPKFKLAGAAPFATTASRNELQVIVEDQQTLFWYHVFNFESTSKITASLSTWYKLPRNMAMGDPGKKKRPENMAWPPLHCFKTACPTFWGRPFGGCDHYLQNLQLGLISESSQRCC